MESRLNDLYPFKAWMATLIFAAVIFVVIAFFVADKDFFAGGGIYGFLFYLLLFSFLFSLPTFIVYYVCFLVFGKRIKSSIAGKTIFSFIAIAGMLITVYVCGGIEAFSPDDDSSYFLWVYTTSILLAGFLFRFRIRETSPSS